MNQINQLETRIFQIIEPAKNNDKRSRQFDILIIILIIANVFSVILGSFQTFEIKYRTFLNIFELISIIIFSIEYLLRLFTASKKFPDAKISKSLISFIFSPMAIIDLFAILPFYLPLFFRIDLRFLRILRLTRLLRVLKVNRYSKSLQLLNKVLKRKKEELIVTIFVTMLLMLLAASIMFYLETDEQPEAFPNIIASFWWAIATLTTVGYGDVYPVTLLGKILAGVIALLGIGLVALPTGIISSGFMEEFNEDREKKKRIANRNFRRRQYRRIRLKMARKRKTDIV